MIYAAFSVWLFLVLFLGLGVYRLLVQMLKAGWVNWALLPGTIVSEMAYIFGCLITGGEIRRAKILPTSSQRAARGDSEPATESTPKLKVIGPILASMIAVVACAGAILGAGALLGGPVLDEFSAAGGSLSKSVPTSWSALWDQLAQQVILLRRTCEALGRLEWLNWRVPLFVYIAMCLSVRLAPVRRDLRAALAAVVVLAGVIAVVGRISRRFTGLLQDIWPLLAYVYATLLLLMVVVLLVRGVVGLVRVLAGKSTTTV